MKTYLCSYNNGGFRYGFEIKAESMEEAKRHIQCIRQSCWLDGELMATLPAPSFMERVLAWWHSR